MIKELIAFDKMLKEEKDMSEIRDIKNVEEFLNVPYKSFDGYNLSLDIYKPLKAKEKTPVMVVVHGGGFEGGDHLMELPFCKKLCEKGLLVYSLEYRLLNKKFNVFDQIRDVQVGYNYVLNSLNDYQGDKNNIYLISESAGAYLALYATMFSKLNIFKKWFNYNSKNIDFKGNIFVSGLFYTNRFDIYGLIFKKKLFKQFGKDKELMKLMDPDNDLIAQNVDSSIFVTSNYDFLKKQSIKFKNTLNKKEIRNDLLKYEGDKELCHAFMTLNPLINSSKDALDKCLQIFKIR